MLSANFSLSEFTRSQTAKRLGLIIRPSSVQTERIRELCARILQPIRDKWGAVRITSGFRTPPLNSAIGGAPQSQHMCAGPWAAADIHVQAVGNLELAWWIVEQRLPFDQLLLEHHDPTEGKHSGWIHVSHRTDGTQRGDVKRVYSDRRGLVYQDGLPTMQGGK